MSIAVLAAALACHSNVHAHVLPVWARGGFSDPRPVMPYTVGRGGRIAALVFGQPLSSPPAKDHANKILWVSRRPAAGRSDLRISAQRMNGVHPIGKPVGRAVDNAPGPSIVDLPAAGCWRLTLRWSGRTDVLDLQYSG